MSGATASQTKGDKSMKKAMAMMMASVALCALPGYGEHTMVGAWALATSPDKACFVVTNRMVWALQNGCWRPSPYAGESMMGHNSVSFRLIGDATAPSVRNVLFYFPEDWRAELLEDCIKAGASVKKGDVIWALQEGEDANMRLIRASKIVRAKMPDWSKVLDEKRYHGCWKLVGRKSREGRDGEVPEGEKYLLKIREDRTAVQYFCNMKPTESKPEPYLIRPLLPVEGGLRFDYREEYKEHDDPLNCRVDGLWLDADGRLVNYYYDGLEILVRTTEKFDDPIDKRLKMMSDKAFHGVWGVSVEFNIMVFVFDRSGRGYMSGFMSLVPFTWKAKENGVIHGVFDKELMMIADPEFPVEFDCRYDPKKNAMHVDLPTSRDNNVEGRVKRLPFMSWDARVDEVFARVEECKKSPQWRMEFERRKKEIEEFKARKRSK